MPVHRKPTADDLDKLASEQVAGLSDITQTPTKRSTVAVLKRYDVRFHPDDWDALKRHFSAKGLSISAGLRMIVKEYMNRE